MSKKVTDSQAFKQRRAFAYLEDRDRLLTGAAEPQFTIGFIGCGMMGLEHMRNTQLLGRARIGGIFDPADKSVQHALTLIEKHQPRTTPKVYSSLADACADPSTDVLVIATPNFTHLDVMRVATLHNKAILLEKPIATNVTDALEVCRLAANHTNIVRFGLQYRYKSIYAEAIDEVFLRHSVGRVHNVSMLEHRFPFLDKVGQWNKFNAYTGGTLIEKCCHYFDLINLFAGSRPQQVFASGNQAVNFQNFTYDNKQADGLDQAQVIINYENGVIGSFSLCMFIPGSAEELVVCGDAGRLHATETAQLGQENQNRLEVWAGENGASRITTPSYPSYISSAGHHGSTFFEHAAFMQDITSGEYQGPSAADALWSVVVGAAAQESIEQGANIDITDVLPDDFDEQYLPVNGAVASENIGRMK